MTPNTKTQGPENKAQKKAKMKIRDFGGAGETPMCPPAFGAAGR